MAPAVFFGGMHEIAGLERVAFDIRWVSRGIRVAVNSAPADCRIAIGLDYQRGNLRGEPREVHGLLRPMWILYCYRLIWKTCDAGKPVHKPRDSLDRSSFARRTLIVKMVTGVGGRLATQALVFCTTLRVFCSARDQQLDDFCDECAWVCCVWLRSWQNSHFVPTTGQTVDCERCTAILVGPSMLLSVDMPHSGHEEEE